MHSRLFTKYKNISAKKPQTENIATKKAFVQKFSSGLFLNLRKQKESIYFFF